MSDNARGRHRSGRHSAPKKKVVKPNSVSALAGLAGVSSVIVTGGSAIPTMNATVVKKADDTTTSLPVIKTPVVATAFSNRAAAASRSDNRDTLAEAEASAQASTVADPGTDLTAVIDTTPTLKNTDVRAIQSIAASAEDLDLLVTQVQDDANQRAQLLVQQQDLAKAAAAEAEAKVAAAIKKAEDQKKAIILQQQRILAVGKVIVPVQVGYQLTARFGQHGRIWSGGVHTGLDFDVPIGTPVYAAASGVVIEAGYEGSYGYRIVIENGDGFQTTYNHMSKLFVGVGAVTAGTNIGLTGSTGNTTGPHLHFEVLKDGEFVNPAGWLWGTTE
ncbi:MAG: hypothetical protein RIR66_27 [Actinomycetota bacterium]